MLAVVVVTDIVVSAVVCGGDVGFEVNLNKFVLKGVFSKNERGYRLTAKNKRF